MSPLYMFLVLLLGLSSARVSRRRYPYIQTKPEFPQYWSDYNFYSVANSWLMLHKIPATWDAASKICESEGAVLASPTTEGLNFEMKNIIESGKVDMIYTGNNINESDNAIDEGEHVSDPEFADQGTVTSDLTCVAMRSDGVLEDVDCVSERAFICYKATVEAGTGYIKNEQTGSGYKYHNTGATWDQANATCTAEGGHLAIINSDTEAEELMSLLHNVNCNSEYVHIGFYNEARFNGGVYGQWLTVDGQTLDQAGYSRWSSDEPNNYLGKELCGNIIYKYYNFVATLNDYLCYEPVPFICEIDYFESQ